MGVREEEHERIFGQLKINLRSRISRYLGAKSEGDGTYREVCWIPTPTYIETLD